jgi:signal transduction histidine kinase/ActR/RegA family two-component response regulator
MPHSDISILQFEEEVELRLGVLPNFFRSTPDAPELIQQLWVFAKAAYLDNPLPALFKERLFVHISRSCNARYCIVRHVGFLLGYGYPAGDANAKPQTIQEVISLLHYPPPSANEVHSALARLSALSSPLVDMPGPGGEIEQALFQASCAIFLDPERSEAARNALRHALGGQRTELILNFIAFVRTAHLWTITHPEIPFEHDMKQLIAQEEELATLLLTCEPVDSMETGLHLYGEIDASGFESGDRTTLLAVQKALKKRDIQQGKFISMLGHELRNPVAAISAVSDMFQILNIADNRLQNASQILQRQTKALTRMLDDIFDVSSLALGKISLLKNPIVIDDVLTAVVRDFDSRMKEKGLKVSIELPNKPACVLADRNRLTQLFANILSNALTFTKAPGSVTITARVEETQVKVSFTDTGTGFEPKFARKMFEPFAQAPQDLSRSQGGLGLGLAIAKMIADLHGGSLEAASTGIGKGATFTLSLPVMPPSLAGEHEHNAASHEKSRVRVIAIEDNRDFAHLFRHMLEIMGCDITVNSDARSGLKSAHEIMPDLIFCDIGLPGDMNGFDFARAVRADSKLAHIPLVAVSGYSSAEDRQHAIDAGFNRICAKPVKFADINDVLATFSKNRPSGR